MRFFTLLALLICFQSYAQVRNGDFETSSTFSNGSANLDEWLECSIYLDSNAYSGEVAAAITQFCPALEANPGYMEQFLVPTDSSTFDSAGAIYMYVNIEKQVDTSTWFGVRIDGYGGSPREYTIEYLDMQVTSGYELWWAPYQFSYRPDSLLLLIASGNSSYFGGGGLPDTVLIDSVHYGPYRTAKPFSITSAEAPAHIKVYPVPSQNFIQWEFASSLTLEKGSVLDSHGQVVQDLDVSQNKVYLQHLPGGVYILRFELENGEIIYQRFLHLGL